MKKFQPQIYTDDTDKIFDKEKIKRIFYRILSVFIRVNLRLKTS